MHDDAYFATLTYADDPYQLQPDHLTKFHNDLRTNIYPNRYSYYSVGEYGDDFGRPHYHSIIYGINFNDLTHIKNSESGRRLYSSAKLTKLWKHGYANLAPADPSAMKYCAGYTLKKMKGDQYGGWKKDEYYGMREFEFMRSSKNPAPGLRWLLKYYKQFDQADYCVIDSKRVPIPDYYMRLMGGDLTTKRLETLGYKNHESKKIIDEMLSIYDNIKIERETSSYISHLAAPLERTQERNLVRNEILTRLYTDYSRNLGD
jgi:hypothetical protein